MAVQLAIESKRLDGYAVWPEDLIVNPEDRGRHFSPSIDAVRALGLDIATNGQRQAIVVKKQPDQHLRVISGFTRVEAIRLYNAEHPEDRRKIEVKIESSKTALEEFKRNLSENRYRNLTTPIDDAHNIVKLLEFHHLTKDEVLKIYVDPATGKEPSITWLDKRVALASLPEKIQKEIHDGVLAASVGELLAEYSPEDAEAILEVAKDEEKARVAKSAKPAKAVVSVAKVERTAAALGVESGKKKRNRESTGDVAPTASEIRKAWEYIATLEHPVAKIASLVIKFQTGQTAEPDFIRALKGTVTKLASN